MTSIQAAGPLPEDREALRALAQNLLAERQQQQQQFASQRRHIEDQQRRLAEQQRQAEEQRLKTAQLEAELLRVQVELERYKKRHYGPRADRLRTAGELAQLLLQSAEELDRNPSRRTIQSKPPSPRKNAGACSGVRAGAIRLALRVCR